MERNSKEYMELCRRLEEDNLYRRNNPDLFPWFTYHQYGFHMMKYLSEEEAQSEIRCYKLYEHTTARGLYCRYGRQPIFLMRRDRE